MLVSFRYFRIFRDQTRLVANGTTYESRINEFRLFDFIDFATN